MPAVLIGGVGTMLAALAWAFLFPALRDLRTLDEPPPALLDEDLSAKENI